jgi:hypothetical protein
LCLGDAAAREPGAPGFDLGHHFEHFHKTGEIRLAHEGAAVGNEPPQESVLCDVAKVGRTCPTLIGIFATNNFLIPK